MMSMLMKSWKSLKKDTKKEFKSLFVTNLLYGTVDHLVFDKLYPLIGADMFDFRKQLMLSNSRN